MSALLALTVTSGSMGINEPNQELAAPVTTPSNDHQAHPTPEYPTTRIKMTRQKRTLPIDSETIAEPPTKKQRKEKSTKKASSRQPSKKVAIPSKPASGKKTAALDKEVSRLKQIFAMKHREDSKESNTKNTKPIASAQPLPLLEQNLHDKIKQVETLVRHTPTSMLLRLKSDEKHHMVCIPEITLIGALIAMRLDYNIGTRSEASVSDVEDIIHARYTDVVGEMKDQSWITIDFSKPGSFEQEIRTKLGQHGEGLRMSLLEAQLEMFAMTQAGMDYDDSAGLSNSTQFRATFDEIWARVQKAFPPRQA